MNREWKQALSGDLQAYRSIPFWSWNNSLDEAELCRQINDMKAAGIGGFIMHARTGLKEEYLGEKWFSCIEACLDKAKTLGMEAWVYDENGWPSGFVGGKLLENEAFRARYLEYAEGAFDPAAFAVFVRRGGGFVRVEGEQAGETEYHNVYLRVSPANTDILDPAVVDAFIAETHEKYYARFKERFGKELAGFFTDEPQYYRWGTPYTPVAEAEFAKDGEDIRDGLIWLFVQGEGGYAFREKYFDTLNRLYTENFYKKLYDWCEAHGCKLTGHSVEESLLFGQMWGGAAVMPSYEFEHIPGIDWLGRDCGTELSPRQVGSAAAQLGKKFVLTETFGCAGYDVTPKELKSIAEYQYFNGVNKMCQHLYPYSLAGRGKTDHPPVFSPQGNWFEGFRAFNDYFARLGCIVAETQDEYEVGIIHPIRGIWLDYLREKDYESVKEAEDAFGDLLCTLRRHGVTYHFLDERLLARRGGAEGGCLRLGGCRYDTVIVPPMRTLTANTCALLQTFGGRLCVLGKIGYIDGKKQDVSLPANTTLEEICASARYGFSCEDGNSVLTARHGKGGEFLFVKNLSRTEKSRVRIEGAGEKYVALDLETLEERPLAGDGIVLGGAESAILLRAESSPVPVRESAADVTAAFRVAGMTENFLVLDYAQIAREGGAFGARRPITALFEELLREDYKGTVRVRQTFTLAEPMPLTLVMEKAALSAAAVNGAPVSFAQSAFDVNFAEAPVGALVQKGENVFEYSFAFRQHEGVHFALFDPLATESLRNCLYYDTSIEPAYLKGDFTVGEGFALAKRRALPPVTERLYACGYPFFKGELTLEGELSYGGSGPAVLEICGRFMTADVYTDGGHAALVLDTKKDIAPILRKGKNAVKIVLRSSLRNLFGPHHFAIPEPMSVSPYNFEFRGLWDGGDPADYTAEYHSVPFGAEKILLRT